MSDDLQEALARFEKACPAVARAFQDLHQAVSGEGALSAAEKKLIMIGIAAALRCEPCLRSHVSSALAMGIGRQEILEAAGVAVLMGGGPSMAYTALYVMEELEKGSR